MGKDAHSWDYYLLKSEIPYVNGDESMPIDLYLDNTKIGSLELSDTFEVIEGRTIMHLIFSLKDGMKEPTGDESYGFTLDEEEERIQLRFYTRP